MTPSRDLPEPSLWNFWSDIQFADISDDRYDRDSDTLARSLTMGLDRRITSDLVVGMTVSLEDNSTDAFDGNLGDTDGFSYAAYRLSKHWAVDGSLTYGRYNNDIDLSVLSGQQDSERLAGEISLHGQYNVDSYLIRPKVSVSWSHIDSDAYDLSGSILNTPVSVTLPATASTTASSICRPRSVAPSACRTCSRFWSSPSSALNASSSGRTTARS